MPGNFSYVIDKSDLTNQVLRLSTAGNAAAGTVNVVFPGPANDLTIPRVGPYQVAATSRGNKLSYGLLMIGLIHVLNGGFTQAQTGMVHGILHDTMSRAGMTPGQMVQDPTAKNRWKQHGKSSYLTGAEEPQNSMCIWSTDNIGPVVAECMRRLTGANVTITFAG